MDIQHLVDRLEDLIDEGRHLYGTKLTMIDEERALELIDQMRIFIPEEIEQAARVLAIRDRMIGEAQQEAARIVQDARQTSESLIEQDAAVQSAQARAEEIVAQAQQEAQRIMDEADQYAYELLAQLERQMVRNLEEVRNGIGFLQGMMENHDQTDPSLAEAETFADSTEEFVEIEADSRAEARNRQ